MTYQSILPHSRCTAETVQPPKSCQSFYHLNHIHMDLSTINPLLSNQMDYPLAAAIRYRARETRTVGIFCLKWLVQIAWTHKWHDCQIAHKTISLDHIPQANKIQLQASKIVSNLIKKIWFPVSKNYFYSKFLCILLYKKMIANRLSKFAANSHDVHYLASR